MNKKIYMLILITFIVFMLISGTFLVSWLSENKKTNSIRNKEEKQKKKKKNKKIKKTFNDKKR